MFSTQLSSLVLVLPNPSHRARSSNVFCFHNVANYICTFTCSALQCTRYCKSTLEILLATQLWAIDKLVIATLMAVSITRQFCLNFRNVITEPLKPRRAGWLLRHNTMQWCKLHHTRLTSNTNCQCQFGEWLLKSWKETAYLEKSPN